MEKCGWQMGKMATEAASNALCRHLELYQAKFMWQSTQQGSFQCLFGNDQTVTATGQRNELLLILTFFQE
jgi:hypothetical protein